MQLLAGAARQWCGRIGRLERAHALSPIRGSRHLGGRRLSASRRLPVPVVPRRCRVVRRLPRPLLVEAPSPDQARDPRGREARNRGAHAVARGAHARRRADHVRVLRVDHRQARRLGASLPFTPLLRAPRGRVPRPARLGDRTRPEDGDPHRRRLQRRRTVAPLRPLLGRRRRHPLPALRRLLLRRDRPRDRAPARRLRAGRGRRAQAAAGFRADEDAVGTAPLDQRTPRLRSALAPLAGPRAGADRPDRGLEE